MSVSQLEVDYGPQPYDRSQGGPLVFSGAVQDTDATSVHIEVTIRDTWGSEVFRDGVAARKQGAEGQWEFSLAWEPGAAFPDGDYGPFFNTTRTYPNQCPVMTDEPICNGIICCHRGSRRRGRYGPDSPGGGPPGDSGPKGPCPELWDLRGTAEDGEPGASVPGDPSSSFGSVASTNQGPGF